MSRFTRALTAVLAVAALLCPGASADFDAKATASAKVYASASASSEKLATLDKGTRLTVTDFQGGWAKIDCGGRTGYCGLSALTSLDRSKAYIQKKTNLYSSASSEKKICSVSAGAKVYRVATDGDWCLIQNPSNGRYGYVKADCVGKSAPSSGGSSDAKSDATEVVKSKVTKLAWNKGGSSVLKKGETGYMYDIASGITIKIKRMGGSSHMDVEPYTAQDTAKLLKIYGGKFSWDSKAVILIAGGKYVAAAINGMPHGEQTISDNDYDGQFCLHLLGSQTHGTESENAAHQANVEKAYKWARG